MLSDLLQISQTLLLTPHQRYHSKQLLSKIRKITDKVITIVMLQINYFLKLFETHF